ncbi:PIN domain-like protein [Flammula alnicola]|nr:PIN domain-like protein [Flammula alnicola]
MGVNGFTPFLQKICPAVLKKLPNRLEALQGKRIVIDGTLITQRFHYMSQEHPHRHVLGWYRLAQELNRSGVSAICVFDGKERAPAKANETKRRREIHQLSVARGSIEDDRFERLHDLKASMDHLQTLDLTKRQEVVKILKDSKFGVDDGSSTLLQEQELVVSEEAEKAVAAELPSALPPTEIPTTPPLEIPTSLLVTPDYLATLLKSLNLSYKVTIAKLVSLSTETAAKPPETVVRIPPEEERAEKIMTKDQYQLTVQEGKIWNELAASLDTPTLELPAVTAEEVDALLGKSYDMATSFQRRNNSPTAQTYSESKEILRAMGIPCIEALGAVEAEALASSMVLKGFADYVASEDTDVLVYEAPMIRNLTGHEPLLVISGADVRTELGLDRKSYVDFALLLGTDFSQRIKNMGPVRAYDFIKKYGSIEHILDIIESQPKYELKLPRKAYLAQVQIARLVFDTLPPLPPSELMQPIETNIKQAMKVLQHYDLGYFLLEDHLEFWDYSGAYGAALGGNAFGDDPRDI